jgi:hypothetical protein
MKDGFYTFEDLKFETDLRLIAYGMEKHHAKLFFKNGYGVSVISGHGAYGDKKRPFELAVMEGTEDNHTICYDTPVTDDVLGYLTADDVTTAMIEVQKLKGIEA